MSKGLIAKINLKKGQKISRANIDFARPAKYLYSFEIGKILKKIKEKYSSWDDVKNWDFV